MSWHVEYIVTSGFGDLLSVGSDIKPIYLMLFSLVSYQKRVHIRQVSSQQSCGDKCQIWTRFKKIIYEFILSEILMAGELTNSALITHNPENHMSNQ